MRFLNDALPNFNELCTAENKQELKENTTNDVQAAKETIQKYKEKKWEKIEDLVIKVQLAQEHIKAWNEALVSSGLTPIPFPQLLVKPIVPLIPNPFNYTPHFTQEQVTTTPISSSPGSNCQGSSSTVGSSSAPGTSLGPTSSPGTGPQPSTRGLDMLKLNKHFKNFKKFHHH